MSMSEQDRQKLAEKLAGMTYPKARKEVRRLDPDANLKIWRTSVGDNEHHTTYECPNLGAKVILVETLHEEPKGRVAKADYYYVEARVIEFQPV